MAEERNAFIEAAGQSLSDMLHRVIGNTFIVEYGIVKAVPAEGIVTVEMSVSDEAKNIIITDCVLASLASSSVAVRVKPNVDDKVIVLFPRKFHGDMFQPSKNEPILSEGGTGYNILGGIAVLLNQFQPSAFKNFIGLSDGSVMLKMAYSEDESKNLLTLQTNADGEFSFASNNVGISANKDSEITVTNGKATVKIDKDGNVTVDAQGKYTVKNGSTDLKQVIDGLANELENLTTEGSASAQATSVASKGTIAVWRSSQLASLFS